LVKDELNDIKNRMMSEILQEHKDSNDLTEALAFLREIHAMAVQMNWHLWITRQALVMALEFDTLTALEKGITRQQLDNFDTPVKVNVRELHEEFKRQGVQW
jgi:hypothetical protein